MKINTLRLENFQGIKAATFNFKGQSASIYGDNATGKTTAYNALTWLLFDRPSTGAKGYTPKTKGPDGDMHYLDHAAEAQFIMDSGRLVTLRKVFHENYKKKRGSATEEFDGHSVDFFIDGVPVKEKEYTAALLGFCGGAEQMKMLTMPHYFPEDMPWEARRKILLEVCGDVSDTEVISSSDELKELPSYLLMRGTVDQYYTVDEYKKIATAQKADINKQLLGIPGRIDEAQRAIPDEAIDVVAIDAQLATLQTKQDRLMEQKAALLRAVYQGQSQNAHRPYQREVQERPVPPFPGTGERWPQGRLRGAGTQRGRVHGSLPGRQQCCPHQRWAGDHRGSGQSLWFVVLW
ncbi:MAG: AAA family ATPase [Oscillibacter sp.]|nr:AAA family ATPase [Oscillibacter sp.]